KESANTDLETELPPRTVTTSLKEEGSEEEKGLQSHITASNSKC
ncbi:MAG: hypothetical protein UU55_C0010G0043, partial [candidate division WWE3 bacterium GW2011_GWC2_41_23]